MLVPKNDYQIQQTASAAAINLARLFNWLIGECPKETRVSPFQALAKQVYQT